MRWSGSRNYKENDRREKKWIIDETEEEGHRSMQLRRHTERVEEEGRAHSRIVRDMLTY